VTTRLVFHFKDGSVNDETAVYTQHERFHLVSDHLVQKGQTFPRAIDMTVDGETGEATTRYTDPHAAEKVETDKFDVPPDLSNGLINTLLDSRRRIFGVREVRAAALSWRTGVANRAREPDVAEGLYLPMNPLMTAGTRRPASALATSAAAAGSISASGRR
jgi:hypothetical protein